MPTNQLYGTLLHGTLLHGTLLRQMQQLRPGERHSRSRTWTSHLEVVSGGNVSEPFGPSEQDLSKIAEQDCGARLRSKIANKLPSQATLPSATRRMSRVLDNPHIWTIPTCGCVPGMSL